MSTRTGSEEQAITIAIADVAGSWDARLRAPDCSDADRAHFAQWRDAAPAHRRAFEQLQNIVATLRQEQGRADVRALRDEALRAMSQHRRRRFAWVAAAACLLVVLAGVAARYTPMGESLRAPLDILLARLGGAEVYTTGTGQRSTFVLEDGSSVELNARSRINVVFTESQRRVELVQGQALFNVAQNNRRPFVVRAGQRQIVALGTQFDVRLDSRSLRVTLLEGKVRVENAPGASAAAVTAGSKQEPQEVILTPGKQFVASLAAQTPAARASQVKPRPAVAVPEQRNLLRDIDVAKVTGWRDGRVFLEDLSLADAVAEMNRYSPIQITVTDAQLAQRRVNGMFRAGEQEAFVAALEQYFPIAVQHRGDQEIVLATRR